MAGATQAVVVGASIAGILAAQRLSRHVDDVIVVDRDELPEGPQSRKGVPQALHAHLLWSGGARLLESMLPGITGELLDAGARRLGLHEDLVTLSPFGWQQRFSTGQFMITCSRPLLDHVVGRRVLADPRIRLRTGTEVTGLLGDAQRVTGVRLRQRGGDAEETLHADIVVEAAGRGSRLRNHLAALGVPEVRQDLIDSGLVYASRRFRAPAGADDIPMLCVYADHRDGIPGRNGLLMPVEDGQWLVTLSGTRGAEPVNDPEQFVEYSRGLRHPLIADFIQDAEPLTPVQSSRSTVNRRLHYEWITPWPQGLVALGDAVTALNPVYGHGMTAAARSAAALDALIDEHGLTAPLFRQVQRSVAAAVDDPWFLAVSQDTSYPGCRTEIVDTALLKAGGSSQFADLLGKTALGDPAVSAACAGVTSLSAPMTSLQRPEIISALRQGPPRPPLTGPPLTEAEAVVSP